MKRLCLISLTADLSKVRVGENLGIRYIKAFLDANGYKADILENQFQQLEMKEMIQILEEYDVIGFSINYCGQISILKNVLNHIKGDKLIYLGGHFATICHERLLKDFPKIDFVMLADGEYSTLELTQKEFDYKNVSNVAYRIKGEIVYTPFVLIEQLDRLPFPYRDNNSYYLGEPHFSVISSRGCYNNCSYCSVGAFTKSFFNHRVRFRSAQNIYEELKMLKDVYHVKYITFQDDLFIGTDPESQKRAKELANIMIETQINIFFSIQCSVKSVNYDTFALLYKAGLRNVMIGIENFSLHALHCFCKPQNLSDIENAVKIIREIGIPISYGFIMYYPEVEPEEILENIEALHSLGIINLRAMTNKLQIYVGTPYFEKKLDHLIAEERTGYVIKYQFKNPKITKFIETCKIFESEYGHIERKLYRLEFLSHSNLQMNTEEITKLFLEYRKCLYHFAKAAYSEVFNEICNKSGNIIRKQMLAIEKAIEYLYNENQLI